MIIDKIKTEGEYIKLQDALKLSGAVETGGQAKLEIQSEKVSVNGEICTMRGKKLRKGDKVLYKGEVITIE